MSRNTGLFLEPHDVAGELGVSLTRARQLMRDRTIPAVELAGRLVTPRGALAAWIEGEAFEALAALRGVRSRRRAAR